MIPDEAKEQFEKLIAFDMRDGDKSLEVAFNATNRQMAARGLAGSGNELLALAEHAQNALRSRAHVIFGHLLRCLACHHVVLDEATEADANKILEAAIRTQATNVEAQLSGLPAFRSSPSDATRLSLLERIRDEGQNLIAKQGIELDLAAASAKNKSSERATQHFHGPVGVVQTGDMSQAIVHQQLDADLKAEIASALRALTEQLDKPENRSIKGLEDLRELIVDAERETSKTRSNPLKLGASLRGIAESVKFVGSLGPAYQVLKPLLSQFGIYLP